MNLRYCRDISEISLRCDIDRIACISQRLIAAISQVGHSYISEISLIPYLCDIPHSHLRDIAPHVSTSHRSDISGMTQRYRRDISEIWSGDSG